MCYCHKQAGAHVSAGSDQATEGTTRLLGKWSTTDAMQMLPDVTKIWYSIYLGSKLNPSKIAVLLKLG